MDTDAADGGLGGFGRGGSGVGSGSGRGAQATATELSRLDEGQLGELLVHADGAAGSCTLDSNLPHSLKTKRKHRFKPPERLDTVFSSISPLTDGRNQPPRAYLPYQSFQIPLVWSEGATIVHRVLYDLTVTNTS